MFYRIIKTHVDKLGQPISTDNPEDSQLVKIVAPPSGSNGDSATTILIYIDTSAVYPKVLRLFLKFMLLRA